MNKSLKREGIYCFCKISEFSSQHQHQVTHRRWLTVGDSQDPGLSPLSSLLVHSDCPVSGLRLSCVWEHISRELSKVRDSLPKFRGHHAVGLDLVVIGRKPANKAYCLHPAHSCCHGLCCLDVKCPSQAHLLEQLFPVVGLFEILPILQEEIESLEGGPEGFNPSPTPGIISSSWLL